MRGFVIRVTALVVAGMLWASAQPVAHACQCILGKPAQYPGSLAQYVIDNTDAIVVGEPLSVGVAEGGYTAVTVHIERYLEGRGPSNAVMLDDGCVGRISPRRLGESHLLFLYFSSDGLNISCLSGTVAKTGPAIDLADPSLDQIESILGRGNPPDDSLTRITVQIATTAPTAAPQESLPASGSPFPTLPAAIAAVLGPLAFLAGAGFVWGRKGDAG